MTLRIGIDFDNTIAVVTKRLAKASNVGFREGESLYKENVKQKFSTCMTGKENGFV